MQADLVAFDIAQMSEEAHSCRQFGFRDNDLSACLRHAPESESLFTADVLLAAEAATTGR